MTHHVDDILGRLRGPQGCRTQHLLDELNRESHDRESLTPPDAATLYPARFSQWRVVVSWNRRNDGLPAE
jgi:hypothetical protein